MSTATLTDTAPDTREGAGGGSLTGPEGPALWPTQRHELDYLRANPRALLLSVPGAGKTPVMLTYAGERMGLGERVLWVTGKGLQAQLSAEALRWLPADSQPVLFGKHGPDDLFIMVGYEKLHANVRDVAALRPAVVIADEAQAVKGGGVLWHSFRQVTRRVPRVVLATATPCTGVDGSDVLNLLRAGGFRDVPDETQFAPYVTRDAYRNPNTPTLRGLHVLQDLLRRYGIRTTVAPVDVPTVTTDLHQVQPIKAQPARQRRRYGQPWAEAHRQRKASRDADALVPEVLRLLTGDYVNHAKAVVFTENRDVLLPLLDALTGAGIGVVTFDGSASARQRAAIVEQHRDDPGVRVLLATSAVEEGLNLQHASLLVTVVDTYSPSREEQREGRIVRPGSPHSEVTHAVVYLSTPHQYRKARRGVKKIGFAERLLSTVPDGERLSALLARARVPCCEHGERVPRSGISRNHGTPYFRWDCPNTTGERCPCVWHDEPETWDALVALAGGGA